MKPLFVFIGALVLMLVLLVIGVAYIFKDQLTARYDAAQAVHKAELLVSQQLHGFTVVPRMVETPPGFVLLTDEQTGRYGYIDAVLGRTFFFTNIVMATRSNTLRLAWGVAQTRTNVIDDGVSNHWRIVE